MKTELRAKISCRAGKSADNNWYQLFPEKGEVECTATIAGEQQNIVLVIDDEAISKMLASHDAETQKPNWGGYLVCREHWDQENNGDSSAHAWCLDLEERGAELWGRFEKTPLGEKSIGAVYKYRSPVADLEHISGRRYRPVHITSIGLTNRPLFKTLAAAQGRAANNPKEEEDRMLERMKSLLGLSEDATEDKVVARVQRALQAEKNTEETKQKLETLQGEVLAREADTFVSENKDLIDDTDQARDAVKQQYIAARDNTKAVFGSLRKKAEGGEQGGGQRVLAREGAQAPQKQAGSDDGEPSIASKRYAAKVSARARELVQNKICATQSEGYAKAREEISEEG